MPVRPLKTLLLPVFGGQGNRFFDLDDTSSSSYYPASSSGAVLLDACLSSFHAELGSLSFEVFDRLDIRVEDFKEKTALLRPASVEYLFNPVISNSSLLLLQALQYLRHIEKFPECLDIPQSNGFLGVVGFSSGVLTAAVVAASRSPLDFINHAVEAYRLAIWIGIRSQLYRCTMHALPRFDLRPWVLTIFCVNQKNIQDYVDSYNEVAEEDRIHLTVVMNDNCATVSGHPDDLASFTCLLPEAAQTYETKIFSLYHAPSRLQEVRDQVLKDASTRLIRFPTLEQLLVPLRSSHTGHVVEGSSSEETLMKIVLDMILMQPVHWDLVVERTVASISLQSGVHIVNVGLGRSLLSGLEKSLLRHGIKEVNCQDLANEDANQVDRTKQEPVAVIGMAVNMPGAPSVDELWNILSRGTKTLEHIPADRFDFSVYTGRHIPGREMSASKGNFVKNVGDFDNVFFSISPREAKHMDPQQRLLLHSAYEALEDAGYVPFASPAFSPETFGCYIGATTHDYVHNLSRQIDVYHSTGTLATFLSGRLSYFMGFSGPSMVIDTACSSSMVAIYQAARALANRDCNAAIAGGVNVIASPDAFLGLDRGHFLSPSGQCKTFDAAADGYGRSEGCGIFVLKRLSDALTENDRILGVIRGIEVNQSGKAHSITQPHVPTQQALFKQVLEESCVHPEELNVVEAHGTATQAGDVSELQAIRQVLAGKRAVNNPLYVGSIKSNIGHLESASGAASLAKVLLMLRYATIPAQISLELLNPKIPPLHTDGTVISTTAIPWKSSREGKPRLALINNFGASGSNAAAVVEEFISKTPKLPIREISSYVFGISAKDEVTLGKLRGRLLRWLQERDGISLKDVSYTLMARRQLYPHRLVISAGTKEDLVSHLTSASPTRVLENDTPSIVFVFSGYGGQYHGTGSSLYRSSPLFKRHIDECDSILVTSGFRGVSSVIVGYLNDEAIDRAAGETQHTVAFSLQYALAMLWISWGIRPGAVVGHSLGEYAALVTAGALTLREGLIAVATRERQIFERCAHRETGMVAIAQDAVRVQTILDSLQQCSGLTISCFNSPEACVVSGPISELSHLRNNLEPGSKSIVLDVPFGYHSPALSGVVDDLLALGRKFSPRLPAIPVISTVFGRVIMPGDRSFCRPDYFARHCVDPVRFVEGIESYLSHSSLAGGKTTWLEIGPHPSLLPMLRTFPQLSDSNFLASFHIRLDNWSALSKTLASLYLIQSVDWRAVFSQIGPSTLVSLPSYPFTTKHYWIPFREPALDSYKHGTLFSLIGRWGRYPNDLDSGLAVLETQISDLKPYIEGHRVGGVPLCPASVYLELAAASTTLALKHSGELPEKSTLVFHQFTFSKPLISKGHEDDPSVVRVRVDAIGKTCVINSSASSSHEEVTHAEASYRFLDSQDISDTSNPAGHLPFIEGRIIDLQTGPRLEMFSTRTVYELLFPRVVDYSKEFHTIQSLSLSRDTLEAVARIRIDTGFNSESFVLHPLFMDTLLHVPGFVANLQAGQNQVYICSEVASITIRPFLIARIADYTIYSKNIDLGDGMLCESYAVLEGASRVLVAHAKAIRFQRIRLSALEAVLSSTTRPTPTTVGSRVFALSTSTDSIAPSISLETSRSEPNIPDRAATVKSIFCQVLDLDEEAINEDDDLGSLGLDSLASIEVIHLLSDHFHFHPPTGLLNSGKTIREIYKQLFPSDLLDKGVPSKLSHPEVSTDSISKLSSGISADKLWLLQSSSNGSRTPLVLVHDGSGLATCYQKIGNIDRNVYGINNPNFFNSRPWLSIAQIAESYAMSIRQGIQGPVILGGWSFGGILAFEIAKILQIDSTPVRVKGVILIDSPNPLNHVPLSPSIIDYILDGAKGIDPETRRLCLAQFLMNAQLLGAYDPMKNNSGETAPVTQVVYLWAKDAFDPPALVDVPAWLAHRTDSTVLTSGWEVLFGTSVTTLEIPGNHFEPFRRAHVSSVSERISEACAILDV